MDKKRSSKIKKVIKEHLLILFIFITLSLIFTYPVIANITTHSAGDGGDGLQFIWNIWHIKNVIMEGGGISDLYYTSNQFYPQGTSLAFHTLSLTNTLFIAFPLIFLTSNLVFIYNLLFLLSFILAGYGMYLLIKYLTKNKSVAFLVGFAYAFSPIHQAWSLGYLNLMSVQWLPFFFLFFIKIFDEEKIKNSIISAIFLFLLSLSSWYHLLYAFLIALPYFFYRLIKNPRLINKNFVFRMILFVLSFLIAMAPFVHPMITEYFSEEIYEMAPRWSAVKASSYLTPLILKPILGDIEGVVFLGFFVLIVSVIYFIKTKEQKFWILIAALFFILSINPESMILKLIIKIVPFYNVISSTGRFAFGVLFSILIIFGYALNYFIPKWKRYLKDNTHLNKKILKVLLVAIILAILIVEYIAPYPSNPQFGPDIKFFERGNSPYKIGSPAAYSFQEEIRNLEFISNDSLKNQNFTILSLPFFKNSKELYLQIYHEKPIIGGYISRYNLNSIQDIKKLEEYIKEKEIEKFYTFLRDHKVRYIVVYDKNIENLNYVLGKTPLTKISENEFSWTTIYEVENKSG